MGKHRSVKSLKQSLHSPSPHRNFPVSLTLPINPIMGDDKKDLESECNDSPSGMNPIIVYSIIAVVCLVGGFVLGMVMCGGTKGTELYAMTNKGLDTGITLGSAMKDGLPVDPKKIFGSDGKTELDTTFSKAIEAYMEEVHGDKPMDEKTHTFTIHYKGKVFGSAEE